MFFIVELININDVKEKDYYLESKRLRKEALEIAETYKGNPKRFSISNGIDMEVEITKSDIKTIVSKNTQNNLFNAVKNAWAKNLEGYLLGATYEGWRKTADGKHPESAFFAYYSRRLGANTYLCVRRMKSNGVYKPYAFIDQQTFDNDKNNIVKEKPPL